MKFETLVAACRHLGHKVDVYPPTRPRLDRKGRQVGGTPELCISLRPAGQPWYFSPTTTRDSLRLMREALRES